MPARPLKDDIERLTRGLPTRKRIGSRGTPHRLTQRERVLFEAAKRNGFLKIPANGIRSNVKNIYRLWCESVGRPCEIQSVSGDSSHSS
jgi:hypothetical protein